DQTAADYAGPPGEVLAVAAEGVTARYVRVTATALWERTADYVFALAELQVLSGGQNVALGRRVQALDSIDAGRWKTDYLVDGFDSRDRLRDAAATEQERKALRMAKRELRRVTREIDALRREALDAADAAALADTGAALARVTAEFAALPAPGLVYAAAPAFTPEGSFTPPAGPRPIFVLDRGDVNAPGARAWPGTVGCLPELPARFGLE